MIRRSLAAQVAAPVTVLFVAPAAALAATGHGTMLSIAVVLLSVGHLLRKLEGGPQLR